MRLAAVKLESITPDKRKAVLGEIQQKFEFPIDVAKRQNLPIETQKRFKTGNDVVFFAQDNDRWFAATSLAGDIEAVRCGPFPSFEQIEQKAATTTLAFVLLPVAFAIALLLRLPVKRVSDSNQ